MLTIYIYILDTLADWELGYVTAELNSGRFFKKDARRVTLKTVSRSKEPVRTMGGLTVTPDCLIEEMTVSETSVLLLPGRPSGMTRSMARSSKKRVSFSPRAPRCAPSAGPPPRLPERGCWTGAPIPATGRDFLKWRPPVIGGGAFMWINFLWRITT